MRVLHLVGQSEDLGGVLSVIRNLQEASAGRGWSHATWVNQAYRETRTPSLEYRYSRHVCAESPSHLRLVLSGLRAFFECQSLLAREAFDVVHGHARGTLVAVLGIAAWLRRPVLFTNHSYGRRVELYRWVAGRPRVHTVLLTPNMARHYGIESTAPRVRVISACCADRFFTEPLAGLGHRSVRDGTVQLVGLGNVARWKNWHLLLSALVQLPESERRRVKFCHWGATPQDHDAPQYAAELQAFVRDHRLENQVLFGGPSVRVMDCLRTADWFVLPSTNEPCSVALIEALALGIPAVVSASGGNVDIVQPGKTGLLFKPEDPVDLADKLRAILNGAAKPVAPPAIRESVCLRSASQVVAEYARVYEQLERNPPAPSLANGRSP